MKRALLVALVVIAAAGGGYAVGAAGGDDAPAIERYVVPGSTDDDPTADKWVTAECPKGSTVVSGGAVVPHGNDTPGVAVYWSAPYEDHGDQGWWAAAQDTRRAAGAGCSRSRRSASPASRTRAATRCRRRCTSPRASTRRASSPRAS